MYSLSSPLQLGKGGEHLVCADLIFQGYNAFLADQGLPFDIIVEIKGRLLKIQVKTSTRLVKYGKYSTGPTYPFMTRKGSMRKSTGRVTMINELDYFAFVVVPTRQIAYMSMEDLKSKNTGQVLQLIEFKTRKFEYPIGKRQNRVMGKFFEDYEKFKPL